MSHALKSNRRRDPSERVAIRPLLDPDSSCIWCAGSGLSIVSVDRRVGPVVRRIHLIDAAADCPMCLGTGLAGTPLEARTGGA